MSETKDSLSSLRMDQLKVQAIKAGIKGTSRMRKPELIEALRGADSQKSVSNEASVRAPKAVKTTSKVKARSKTAPDAAAEVGATAPTLPDADAPAAPPKRSRRRASAAQGAPQEKGDSSAVIDIRAELAQDLGKDLAVNPDTDKPQSQTAADTSEATAAQGTNNSEDFADSRDRRGDRYDRNNRRRRGRDRKRRRDSDEPMEPREDEVLLPIGGVLDVQDNHAFVRTSGYLPGPNDVYVSLGQVRRWALRPGDAVVGAVRQQHEGATQRQKFNALVRLDSINGMDVETSRERIEFAKLVPLYPDEQLRLETSAKAITPRIIDLVAPIGKGQRGLIVSPPKAGKTIIMQQIANAISINNPEVHLMVVLVDERPEEVTDMQRTVKGEVIASTFDRPASDHTTVAELAIERAKRLVELGQDVVVLLDSITRLGRAYNLSAPASGRILSGGVDASALYPPKRFFGAARNIEGGGSLTIIASALVETGSKMDEVIFEEFKGTGNMELRLSRQLADKRIFPAVDVNSSGTRREEVLFGAEELKIMWKLRRLMGALESQQATELVLNKLKETQSNAEFLMMMSKMATSKD